MPVKTLKRIISVISERTVQKEQLLREFRGLLGRIAYWNTHIQRKQSEQEVISFAYNSTWKLEAR